MERSRKFRFAVMSIFILLYPFSFSCAMESEQGSDGVVAESPGTEEVVESPRWEDQDRYNRLLEEYAQSINEAETDEERARLRRQFEKETRDYTNYRIEEREVLKQSNIAKKKLALEDEYQKKARILKQNHNKKLQQAEAECRRDAFGVDNNRLDLEPERCKKKPLIEKEFKRQSKALENDYNAKLRRLQKDE
jgi:hypothetical protein